MATSRTVRRKSALLAAVSLAIVGGSAATAPAAEVTWTGGGTSDNFSEPANWGGAAATAADALQFGGTNRLAPNNDFAANTTFGGIRFLGGAGAFTLGGNAILLAGDINQDSAADQVINLPVVLNGGVANVGGAGAGKLTLSQVTFGDVPEAPTASTMNVQRNTTVGGLTVQTRSAAATDPANLIDVAAGSTLSLTGAVTVGTPSTSGALVTLLNVTGGGTISAVNATNANFTVGVGNSNSGGQAQATVDMSAFTGDFTYSTGASGTGNFYVGRATRPASTLRLGQGTNTIVAANVEIGNSNPTPGLPNNGNNAGGTSRLYLGSGANVIHTNTMLVGVTKGAAQITWQADGAGTVTIAGQDGVGRTNITLGNFSSGSATGTASQILLANHTANVQAGTVIVGRLAASGSSAAANEITFDKGVFDVNSLQLGVNASGSATNGAHGAFTLGTLGAPEAEQGVLNVNTQFLLGNDTNTNATAPTKATFTVNNGTANINADIEAINNDATDSTAYANSSSTVTLAGGTLNMMGHAIGSYAAPVRTIDITGGTLANATRVAGVTINLVGGTVTGTPTYTIADGGALTTASGLALASGQRLEGGGATAASITGDVTAGAGARVAAGSGDATGTLAFNNSLTFQDGSALALKLSDSAGGANDLINVAQNLTLAGTVDLEISAVGAGPQVGQTYTLINYTGTLTGNHTNFNVGGVGSRSTFTVLDTATTPNTIQLAVGGSAPLALTWTGAAANDDWDLNNTVNWQSSVPAAEKFFNLDTVTFADGPADRTVNVVGTVRPGSVTVDNNTGDYTFAGGTIAGGGALTKNGAAALFVNNANTYAGGTTINAGTVTIGNGGSLGSGVVTNHSLLRIDRTDVSRFASPISGGGTVEHNGTGTTTFAAGSDYTGPTNINAGTVVVENEDSLGSASGTVTVAPGATLDLGGGTAANNIDFGAKQIVVSGTGVGGLGAIVNNEGFNQQNAFEALRLAGDTLVNTNGVFGTSGRIDVRLGGSDDFTDLDLAGHTLTKIGAGQLSLVHADISAGHIVVNEGVLAIETSTKMSGDPGNSVTYNDGTVAQWFNLSGNFAAPLIFNGNVEAGNADNDPAVINSNVTINGALAHVVRGNQNATETTYAGNITGPGSLSKSGGTVMVLSGSGNAYAGGTTITGGTVRVTGTGTVLGTGDVVNDAALEVHSVDAALGGVSGAGTTLIGDGNVATVSADHFRQGAVTVADNVTLVLNPDATAAGLSNVGALTVSPFSKVDLKDNKLITQTPAGTASGGVYADGSIHRMVQTAYTESAWSGFGLTTSMPDAQSGLTTLAILTGEQYGSDTFMGQSIAPTSTIVMYTYGGDTNLDGKLDADDYGTIDFNVLLPGPIDGYYNGDFNYDGVVNADDYGVIDFNILAQTTPFPTGSDAAVVSSSAGLAGVTAVPEPASLSVIAIGAVALLGRRRRRGA